jgi:hypothetical protein
VEAAVSETSNRRKSFRRTFFSTEVSAAFFAALAIYSLTIGQEWFAAAWAWLSGAQWTLAAWLRQERRER